MKAYIIILIFTVLFMWLWKPMIIAGVIWYLLRKLCRYYIDHKEVWEGE